MRATALICDRTQSFSLEDVILQDPRPDQVTIRTHYTGVSIGTEFGLIRAKHKQASSAKNWYPLSTGYQGTGVIESVGTDINDFKIGDEVYFRRNDSMKLLDGTPVTLESGGHCSYIVTKPHTNHGVAKIIPGAPMDVASMFVMPAVGLNGVDMANPRMGETVVVYGAGLIGLGVIAACANRGSIVIVVDINDVQLSIARKIGADYIINGISQDVETEVKKLVPNGADVVFECTGIPQNIDLAIPLCRDYGSFVWQGNYGREPLSMHFIPAHQRRLKMFFPCDDGLQPCRRAVIKNMALGTLPWEHCITHRIDYHDAPAMFSKINTNLDKDIVGVVIKWITP